MNWLAAWILAPILLLAKQAPAAEGLMGDESVYLEQLTAIYLSATGSIDEEVAAAEAMCLRVEKSRMLRLWLRCVAFRLSNADLDDLKVQLPDLIDLARSKSYDHERLELELIMGGTYTAEHSREASLAYFSRLLKDAEANRDTVLMGRIGLKYAEYFYSISDIPAAIRQVNLTLQQLKALDATESLVYHDLLSTMALMLYANGEIPRAIRIWQDSLDWAIRRSHRDNQSIIAYNIANAMVKSDDADDKKIQSLFTLAQTKGKETKSAYAEAMGYYGEGKWRVKRKDFKTALQSLQRSRKMFLELNPTFALLCLIYSAEALIGLEHWDEAGKALEQAEKELKPDLQQEKMMILENQQRLYERTGDFGKSLRYLKKYLTTFKEQVEGEKKNELQKLSSSLGLKVEEERNKILEKEKSIQAEKLSLEQEKNQVLAEQIALLKKFRMVSLLASGLFVLAALALLIVWRQSQEISRSRQRIKEVMDNIHEGILILSPQLTVKRGYSPYLETMLGWNGQSLENLHINRLLFPDAGPASETPIMIKETLNSCLGEKELTWELNMGQLPVEIAFGTQTMELHWQALYSRQGTIRGYLVAIRDVTEDRKMRREMEVGKRRILELQNRIEEILGSDLRRVRSFFDTVNIALPDTEIWIQNEQNISTLFHKLHGWKGAARTLGLKQIATSIHHVESFLDLQQQTFKDRAQAYASWREFVEIYRAFGSLLDQMMAGAQGQAEAVPEDLYNFASGYTREMIQRFQELQLPCDGLSIQDTAMPWRIERLPHIQEALMHAINNSIDHGFMWPSQQHRILPPAHISIRAKRDDREVQLQVQDNGAGINWERLQTKARELGYAPQDGRKLTELLFRDGMSTASGTTQTSGRGVGLGAIKSICEGLNGKVELDEANPNGGTILSMTFPLDELCTIQSAKSAS